MALVGVFGTALPFTLFAYGEERVSSSLAGIWNAVTPLVVLPLAVWLFRTEQMTWRRVTGLAMGFVGVLIILGVWQGSAARPSPASSCASARRCATALRSRTSSASSRLDRSPGSRSMVTYLIPVVATIVGIVVLDEHLEWYQRSARRSCSPVWRSRRARSGDE